VLTLALLQMTSHNVGALLVVKPGEAKALAGIITERGEFLESQYQTLCEFTIDRLVEKRATKGSILLLSHPSVVFSTL
jgi:hypothetical protein